MAAPSVSATAGARKRRRIRLTQPKAHQAAVNYAPAGETLIAHMTRREFSQVLIGPLGSAKTTNNIVKLLNLWNSAPIDPATGTRGFRWAAVRNTYPDLETTTIRDFLEVAEPLGIGQMTYGSPPMFRAHYEGPDRREVKGDISFMAFDLPQHVKKARGLRLNGVWFNELKELEKANVDMVQSRLGRYRPDLYRAHPEAWYGSLGDSNAPDNDHWLARLHREWLAGRLPNWWFGVQPGAVELRNGRFMVNPRAENLRNLAPQYYERMMEGRDEYWIRQNLGNEFVYYADGRPVHPLFNQRLHVATHELLPVPGVELVLGFDFGRSPACAIMQRQLSGQWWVVDEVIGKNTNVRDFGRAVRRHLDDRYQGFVYRAGGDPAGNSATESSDDPAFDLLDAAGVVAYPAYTNDFTVRTQTLDTLLGELRGGAPAFLVSPTCSTLIRGLAGAYQFRRVQVAGRERYHDKPEKGPESHICEAVHYGLMEAGEGAGLVSASEEREFAEVEELYGGWHMDPRHFE